MDREFWNTLSDDNKWILYSKEQERREIEIEHWKKRYFELEQWRKEIDKERRQLLKERNLTKEK